MDVPIQCLLKAVWKGLLFLGRSFLDFLVSRSAYEPGSIKDSIWARIMWIPVMYQERIVGHCFTIHSD